MYEHNGERYFVVDGGLEVDEIHQTIGRLTNEQMSQATHLSVSRNGALEPMIL